MILSLASHYLMVMSILLSAAILYDPSAPLAAVIYTVLSAIFSLPARDLTESPPTGLVLAFVLCVSASLLTVLQIALHLTHYYNPTSQRYVVRILLMVPIYAIDSFWGYMDYRASSLIAVARDTYESYVLYNFFCLLMEMRTVRNPRSSPSVSTRRT